jgi:hypothetical protein
VRCRGVQPASSKHDQSPRTGVDQRARRAICTAGSDLEVLPSADSAENAQRLREVTQAEAFAPIYVRLAYQPE